MKIALFSDLHGFLPEIEEGVADYIFIAGDICPDYIIPQQFWWYRSTFCRWLELIPPCIFIPGNHDFCLEKFQTNEKYYVENGFFTLPNGQTVYGFCRTICPGWAFHSTDEEIKSLLTQANNFDILLTHNPPQGICDRAANNGHHVGSHSILDLIDKVKPKVSIFGHIHEGYGTKWYKDTLCINCAFKDLRYQPRMKYPVLDTETLEINFIHCKEFYL